MKRSELKKLILEELNFITQDPTMINPNQDLDVRSFELPDAFMQQKCWNIEAATPRIRCYSKQMKNGKLYISITRTIEENSVEYLWVTKWLPKTKPDVVKNIIRATDWRDVETLKTKSSWKHPWFLSADEQMNIYGNLDKLLKQSLKEVE